MLLLDNKKWAAFDTYFGDAIDIPADLERLRTSLGTPVEKEAWGTIRDYFLCQGTIKQATAQAIIPHSVPLIQGMAPVDRVDALIDIGIAEGARLKLDKPELFLDLFPESYTKAISTALQLAVDLIANTHDPIQYRYLMAGVANLSGHFKFGDILFCLDGISGKCPTCGRLVSPEKLQDSEYV